MDAYGQRFRVARFERVPERTADQVKLLHLLLRTTRRIGRPMHLFRGLPTAEKAFFAFDAMPRRLADLIGGNRTTTPSAAGVATFHTALGCRPCLETSA